LAFALDSLLPTWSGRAGFFPKTSSRAGLFCHAVIGRSNFSLFRTGKQSKVPVWVFVKTGPSCYRKKDPVHLYEWFLEGIAKMPIRFENFEWVSYGHFSNSIRTNVPGLFFCSTTVPVRYTNIMSTMSIFRLRLRPRLSSSFSFYGAAAESEVVRI